MAESVVPTTEPTVGITPLAWHSYNFVVASRQCISSDHGQTLAKFDDEGHEGRQELHRSYPHGNEVISDDGIKPSVSQDWPNYNVWQDRSAHDARPCQPRDIFASVDRHAASPYQQKY